MAAEGVLVDAPAVTAKHGVRRLRIRVHGIVQGVGFRPFVYREAVARELSGSVCNTGGGVNIDVQGPRPAVFEFVRAFRDHAPPLSRVTSIEIRETEASMDPRGFAIIESERRTGNAAEIPPDVAMCDDCAREVCDPGDRRFEYPFINCTNCGPRFTIVRETPYDRERTTMAEFALCPECAREYRDPANRRYHAEPNACATCGPAVWLVDAGGAPRAGGAEALRELRVHLAAGSIAGIKGLGGFHLACDAANHAAVAALRDRKRRPHKPLAVMCRDLETAGAYCEISRDEARELESACRPIVLLRKRDRPAEGFPALSPLLSPAHGDLGVMLPYTPLHRLLFGSRPEGLTEVRPGRSAPACLVMTSGNRSDEPIVVDNDQGVRDLGAIAEVALHHNRVIWNRCDDSVGYVQRGGLVLIRRSRGFAPMPVEIPIEAGIGVPPMLALGASLNNVFCLAAGRRAFLSQHIGDTDNMETLEFLRESVVKLQRWLGIDPEIVVHDMHPDLPTTHLAAELSRGKTRVAVQHHHAHFSSCLAANGIRGAARALVLDGTGYSPDGTIWGGEILEGTAGESRRIGHLRALPLPGGEGAIRRPARIAAAWLHQLAPWAESAPLSLWRRLAPVEADTVRAMVDRGFNAPLTSSAGRLFDAVAAILGVSDEVSYEGQAAIELEQLARGGLLQEAPRLSVALCPGEDGMVLDPEPLFTGLIGGLLEGVPVADLALAFHEALADALVFACLETEGPPTIVLCGGVFQNRILADRVVSGLEAGGLRAVAPGPVPVNDGGVALGQVLAAGEALSSGWETTWRNPCVSRFREGF